MSQPRIYAFDVLGTLADPRDAIRALTGIATSPAPVADTWRKRQLEYVFRAAAMRHFPPFADITRWALIDTLGQYGVETDEQKAGTIAEVYRRLQPFPDVIGTLTRLHRRGDRSTVLSVAPRSWLTDLTRTYAHLLDDVVSAEDARAYKPDPVIYRHLLTRLATPAAAVTLITANPFDAIGAQAVGLTTTWLRRDPNIRFDACGPRPHSTIPTLTALTESRA
jgi:2-haloacid dehalogenase